MQSSSLSKVILTGLAVTLVSSQGHVIIPDVRYSTGVDSNTQTSVAGNAVETSGTFTEINPRVELRILRTNVKITKIIEKPLPKNIEPLVIEA